MAGGVWNLEEWEDWIDNPEIEDSFSIWKDHYLLKKAQYPMRGKKIV